MVFSIVIVISRVVLRVGWFLLRVFIFIWNVGFIFRFSGFMVLNFLEVRFRIKVFDGFLFAKKGMYIYNIYVLVYGSESNL